MFKQKWFKDMSFQKKLNFVFLCMILLPILIVACGIVFFATRALLENNVSLGAASFHQLESNLVHKLDSYLSVTDWMMTETEMIDALQQDYKSYAQYFDSYFGPIRAASSKAQRMHTDPIEVSLYIPNPNVIPDYQFIYPAGPSVQESAWYKNILAGYGRNVVYLEKEEEKIYLVLGRLLNPFAKPQRQVVLVVRVPEESLYSLFSSEMSYRSIYLIDEYGYIVCSTQRQIIGQSASVVNGLDALLKIDDASDGVIHSGGTAYAACLNADDPFSNWRLISLQSARHFTDELAGILRWGIIFFLTLAAVAFCFLFIFSKRITQRLQNLAAEMEQTATLSFPPSACDNACDEIGVLSRTFQKMLRRIDVLIQEAYVNKLSIQQLKVREQEAELNALQGQINPHFLFNVLECISASLVKRQDDEALEIVERFAFLMRRATDLTRSQITLGEEVQMIQAYMSIQIFRFRNRLRLKMDISSELREMVIPKFSIYPLVENAVVHGMSNKEGPCTVCVRISQFDGVLTAIVEDDGAGMDTQRLSQVLENLSGEQSNGPSIGLNNVHQRIRLYYGESYGLKIESALGQGTRVTLRLPVKDAVHIQ